MPQPRAPDAAGRATRRPASREAHARCRRHRMLLRFIRYAPQEIFSRCRAFDIVRRHAASCFPPPRPPGVVEFSRPSDARRLLVVSSGHPVPRDSFPPSPATRTPRRQLPHSARPRCCHIVQMLPVTTSKSRAALFIDGNKRLFNQTSPRQMLAAARVNVALPREEYRKRCRSRIAKVGGVRAGRRWCPCPPRPSADTPPRYAAVAKETHRPI